MIEAALILACAPTVAPSTIQQVIQVESKGNSLAIGVNGGRLPREPRDAADAAALAQAAINQGYSVDLGLMQVNSSNLRKLGYSVSDMFEPCKNLAAGAKVLTGFYQSVRPRYADPQAALRAALSAYNTGSYSRGFQNGYVAKYVGGSSAAVPAAAQVPSAANVAQIISTAFDARITDTVRPLNATYGAANSYHKHGQAIDFVPRAGLHSINREQIRATLAQRGVRVIELLGPGDKDHDDHWHVAFALDTAPVGTGPVQFAAVAQARPKPTPFNISTTVFVRGQENAMQTSETTMPVVSTNEDDAFVPGVQIEHTAESAELNGAFVETALSEADAWESSTTDPFATAIVIGGKRVGAGKD